jgi:hypothetical protein
MSHSDDEITKKPQTKKLDRCENHLFILKEWKKDVVVHTYLWVIHTYFY